MTPLRKRFYEDMQLHGLAARTQESYVNTQVLSSVRMACE